MNKIMKIDLKRLVWTIVIILVLLIFIYGMSCLTKVEYTLCLSVFGFCYVSKDVYEEIE